MINVGNIVNSRKFAQTFTVYRKSGSWVAGRWTGTDAAALTFSGTVTVPGETDLMQIPEGDRQQGAMCFYSQSAFYLTSTNGTSDEIEWRGNRYRVAKLFPYADFGFYKCIAVKMDPASGVSP